MNDARKWMTLGVLGLALGLTACQSGTPDTAKDEAAIRAVLGAVASDFNAGKMTDMLGHYQDDVVVSAPGAPDIVGKAAWSVELARLPADMHATMRFDTSEVVVGGDLAYERGTYTVDIGGQSATGRHIHIFRRQADGAWKGWRLMENTETNTPVIPVPAAAAPGTG